MSQQEHDQLAAYLASDPDNRTLIADTARAALAAGDLTAARTLVDRHRALAGPSPVTDHLSGLIAMREGAWEDAAATFRGMLDRGVDETGVRYNLAWALAMSGDSAAALPVLDHQTVASFPQAAELHVALLHQQGAVEDALQAAHAALARFPDHRGLNAAVSTLAIDAGDLDLARSTATRAGDHPQALVTLATLAMEEDRTDEAATLFAAALERDAGNARARIGSGLVALIRGEHSRAAQELDAGAKSFGDHLGTWIAAGWAQLIAGDRTAARARFERALAIDASFAEAQGSLGVLSLLAGDRTDAQRRIAIALRLDAACASAALGAAMLAADAGDHASSERIIAAALAAPLDASGRTLGHALARMANRG